MEKLFTLMEPWLNVEPSKLEKKKDPQESGSFPARDNIMFSQSIKKIYWHGLGTWLTWYLVMVILQIILEGCNQRLSDWLVR